MPAGDGRGPMGAGPMTGRGAGFCSGYDTPGYANYGRGFYGYGRGGRGAGMGWRNRPYPGGRQGFGRGFVNYPDPLRYEGRGYSPESELNILKEQAEFLNERIKELESAIAGTKENA